MCNQPILNDQGGAYMEVSYGVTGTLRAEMGGHQPIVMTESIPNNVMSPTGGQSAYAIGNGQTAQLKMQDKVGTLNCMHDQIAVMQKLVTENKPSEACAPMTDIRILKESDINGALQAGAKQNVNSNNVVRQQYAVHRLLPIECERLQGLPDNYTYLPGEKSCSDSARYKALGNGMCQNCADFVIRRIVEEVERED